MEKSFIVQSVAVKIFTSIKNPETRECRCLFNDKINREGIMVVLTSSYQIITKTLLPFILLIAINPSHANQVIINEEIIINSERIYDQESLTLGEKGRFIIDENGLLIIKNSSINITISQYNSFFILAKAGKLILENCTLHVKTINIPVDSENAASCYLIRASKGRLLVNNNQFETESIHTIGFIKSGNWDDLAQTDHNTISNNIIHNFHGGVYLLNATDSLIKNNLFRFNSFGNIAILLGKNITIENNKILFPGRFSVGDGITLVSSMDIIIKNNQISNGSCYGIQIIGGGNIAIGDNTIVDGATYAIYISSNYQKLQINKKELTQFKLDNPLIINSDITISNNYLGQNRYAIAGDEVSNLTVNNNYIIQKFDDSYLRAFFTNNDILFKSLTNLIWENNFYKEAFTQVNGKNLDITKRLYEYPKHGGVII